MKIQDLINELSGLCGLIPEYYDAWDKLRTVPFETKVAALRAMGYETAEPGKMREAIEGIKQKRSCTLIEPVKVVSVNAQSGELRLCIPAEKVDESTVLRWSVTDEEDHTEVKSAELSGISRQTIKEIAGKRIIEVSVADRVDRPTGYYDVRIEVVSAGQVLSGQMRLIITPDRAYLPPALANGNRTWGLGINLYALRSGNNQGVGDLSDLGEMFQWVGSGLGGDFVAINPLHSITNRMPYGVSPYSPLSRLYCNMIYLDIYWVEDVRNSRRATAIIESPEFVEEMERLRQTGLIDYEGVARLKEPVLNAAFQYLYEEHLLSLTERGQRFRLFISSGGKTLDDYATFLSLHEYFTQKGLYHWKDWPHEYHNPGTHEVRMFRERHEKRITFHKYIQWLINEQLGDASKKAEESGMSIGLYRDLAVGSLADGSDVWGNQDIFAIDVNVGAPPDNFSFRGQNWGFPPLIPDRLRQQGYEFFIQVIRENMKHAGAIRIDHALGLFRLYWIPPGIRSQDGVYIRYPSEDLLRIIALESMRNHVVVIAEDLGTVGKEVRKTLKRFGMLSYRLFYYERDRSTREYLPPQAYPEMAVTSITTHDLPTISGFWIGRDIEVRKALNLYPDDKAWLRDLTNRQADRQRLLRALRRAGVLPQGMSTDPDRVPAMTEELCLAVYRYLAMTPSKLLTVNLDDIIGTADQQNLPSTVNEYPNWRRKVPYRIEELKKMEVFRKLVGIREKPDHAD
ncbi:4-alpha-glucanotransferase (amylomaltase) [hydrothermal vent metagenome]|uniref:4-alpha-glucanotransferase n=1 Tax=hydrothermal vent metagenome TaxID=652676 RepID=A0A3B1D5A6_9ZZZZ